MGRKTKYTLDSLLEALNKARKSLYSSNYRFPTVENPIMYRRYMELLCIAKRMYGIEFRRCIANLDKKVLITKTLIERHINKTKQKEGYKEEVKEACEYLKKIGLKIPQNIHDIQSLYKLRKQIEVWNKEDEIKTQNKLKELNQKEYR